jgi:hypothetical protein
MSLIEQAAKRLEELRRAGTALHEAAPGEVAETNEADRMPTPEAIVRALEAQGQPQPIKTDAKPEGARTAAAIGRRWPRNPQMRAPNRSEATRSARHLTPTRPNLSLPTSSGSSSERFFIMPSAGMRRARIGISLW